MEKQIADEILKRLDLLGAKLQLGGGYMWSALLKRAVAEGIADVAVGIIVIGIILTLLRIVLKNIKVEDNPEEPVMVFSFIAALLICIFGIPHIYSGILEIAAPEYYAFKLLMNALSGK